MMNVLILVAGLYVFIGIVSYLVNSNMSFKDRPLALAGKGFSGVLFFVLISPMSMFLRWLRTNMGSPKRISVDASEKDVEFYNLGAIANSRGDYKAAIEYFSKAIEINPGFSEAHVGRGTAYTRMDDPDADSSFYDKQANNAILDLNKAIELDPKSGLAYYHRAITKYNIGNNDGSLQDIEKAKSLGFEVDPGFEALLARRGMCQ